MELSKAMRERRSVRTFKLKQIDLKDIYEALDDARFAPSSGNIQNWRVMIIKEEEKIKEVAVACVRQKWITEAPVVLVVCNEPDDVIRVYGDKGEIYALENVCFFTQNLILALHARGLGSCIVGSFDKVAIKRIIKCPETMQPLFVIPVGVSNEIKKVPKRDEVEDFIYFAAGRWGLARKWRDRDPAIDTDLTRMKESFDKKRKRFFEKVSALFKKKQEVKK
jgi:nitroreductase